jgi:hypothetical protein
MKIIFAENAFGGHYTEKILSEERLFRKFFSNLQLN